MMLSLLLAIALDTSAVRMFSLPASLLPSPSADLAGEAKAALKRFDTAIATEQANFDSLSITSDIAANFATRIALEQAMRRAIGPAVASLSAGDRGPASAAIWRRIGAVDSANTVYLKSVLPHDGWFRISRDGADIARNAWLIVQHSPDQAFQRTIVARMRPLAAMGDVSGADYALLYDRTEMFAGRPQLYGSQMTCTDGRWAPMPVIDPEQLDRRRAAMGLLPMAEYIKKFDEGC